MVSWPRAGFPASVLFVLAAGTCLGACGKTGGGRGDGSAHDDEGGMNVDARDVLPSSEVPDIPSPAPDGADTRLAADKNKDTPSSEDTPVSDAVPPDGNSDIAPVITLAQACTDYGWAACARLYACAPLAVLAAYENIPACADRLHVACLIDVAAPGARTQPLPLARCAGNLTDATCSEFLNKDLLHSCFAAGVRPDDAACFSAAQCGSGYCRLTGRCGTCTARIKVNGACDAGRGDDQCAAGLVCAGGVCVAPSGLNERCSEGTQPCRKLLACEGGTCVQKGENNDTCTSNADCDSTAGYFCNQLGAQAGHCKPLTLPGPTERCQAPQPPWPSCKASNVCDSRFRCVAPAGDTFGCGPNFNEAGCLPPAVCIDEQCRLPGTTPCL